MLLYDDFSKKCRVIFKRFLLLFRTFLSYLVCVPSFKSISSSSLFRKKFDSDNFTPTHRKRLRGPNTSVRLGLIELTEASVTLNFRPLFIDCILQTVSQAFLLFIFVWYKVFPPKSWAVFSFFYLVWVLQN